MTRRVYGLGTAWYDIGSSPLRLRYARGTPPTSNALNSTQLYLVGDVKLRMFYLSLSLPPSPLSLYLPLSLSVVRWRYLRCCDFDDDFSPHIRYAGLAFVIASHESACHAPPTSTFDRIMDRGKSLAKTAIINHRYRSSL